MRPEKEMQPPKLKLGGSKSMKRIRYWTLHEQPTHKIGKVPGMQRRLRRDEFSLLQRIADLGHVSDVTILREKPANLIRNLAFAQHEARLRGAIHRFKKTDGWRALPRRVQTEIEKAAFISMQKGGSR